MYKRFVLIAILALVAVLGHVAVSPPPTAEAVIASFTCDGNVAVTATITLYDVTNLYWLDGDGPGLPTPKQTVGSGTTVVTFLLPGPGTWSNITLYWSRGSIGGESGFDYSASCKPAGCDVRVPLPNTAVVGTITDNAAVFQMPDPNTMTNIVLEVGKTFWMDKPDDTGMFRKVLISCEWVWVEIGKTGPNYDDVWNGTPLPGTGAVEEAPTTSAPTIIQQVLITTEKGGTLACTNSECQ